VEHIARTLLKRYGVVFLRMLEREAAWLPKWRDLLRVYRKLEARGEIRGGRFVAGFSGEQFALPEAVGRLREMRRQNARETLISLSGADPLNLAGILTPGPKLPALTGNRVLYRDGIPLALLQGNEVQFLQSPDPKSAGLARMALLGHPDPESHLGDVTRRLRTDTRHAPSADLKKPKPGGTPRHVTG
jgi:ATP-dependent Lhr-like helicase